MDYKMIKAQEYMSEAKAYEAIRELETLIEEQPKHFEAHVLLGFVNFKLGAITRGRAYIDKALTLAPSPEDAKKVRLILNEQNHLDKKRFYRPDFEMLRKQAKEEATA